MEKVNFLYHYNARIGDWFTVGCIFLKIQLYVFEISIKYSSENSIYILFENSI